MNISSRYVVIDTETTGLDLINDVPIQLAYQVRLFNGNVTSKGVWYHKIDKPLPKIITEITGITDETLKMYGISLGSGAERYHNLIWDNKPVTLLGYNILNFDFPLIQNWLIHYKKGKFKHPPLLKIIDVMQLASEYFKTRKWLKQSVAAERLKLDFDPSKLHDAEYDIDLCWRIFWHITNG